MASFSAGTTFTDGVANDVTAAKLGALVNNATPTSGLIQDRTAETSIAVGDTLLIGDASDSNALKRITVSNFAQTLPTAKITTGTIETATLGTTTATAANITTGTVQTLTSSTLDGNLTGGTFSGTVNSTLGTIGTLNSTTGTIGNLSTTLAGDFTISQGTGTVGTRVAVVNTAQEYSRTHNFDATTLTSATSIAWDLSQNQVARLALSTNGTMADPSGKVDGATYILSVTQSTGTNTLAWNASFKWPGGTTPTLTAGSGKTDIFTFVSNGTSLFGVASQNY